MIPHPSRNFFRQQLLFGLFVWCVMYVILFTGYDIKSPELADLMLWDYYGASFSPNTLWVILNILDITYVVGIIAMIFFQGWGRFLIIIQLVLWCFLTPFMGIGVFTATIDMLSIITGVLIGVPVVLSFFHPCSEYFIKANKPKKIPNKPLRPSGK